MSRFPGWTPVNADVLREAVQELRRKGTTVIFSTHDMAMRRGSATAWFMIYKGKKVLDGAVSAIRKQYGGVDTILLGCGGIPRGFFAGRGLPMWRFFGRPLTDLSCVLRQTRKRCFGAPWP